MSSDARDRVVELTKEKYGKLIRYIAFSILKDDYLAEDVEQEVLWSFVQKYEDKQEMPPGQLKGFLCTAARNKAVDMYRKQKRERDVELDWYENRELTADHIDLNAFEDQYGFGEEMKEFIGMLNNKDRDIICLYYGDGFTCGEIATAILESEEYVKKRLYRARLKLKSIFIDYKGGELSD